MKNRIKKRTIIVAAIPNVLLGWPWFRVFRDAWFEGGGLTVEQLLNGPSYSIAFTIAITSSLVTAYLFAVLLTKTGTKTVLRGLSLAFLIWIGFIVPVLGTQYTFEARSLAYFGITAGYPLIGLLFMGLIIGGWKDKKLFKDNTN